MPRWVFRYVGNKTFDFSSKKKDFLPKNDQNWHFWSIWARPCRLLRCPVSGLVGGCGAGCISQDTYLLYDIHDNVLCLVQLLYVAMRYSDKRDIHDTRYDTIWYYIWIWCCLPCPTSVWRSAFYLHTSPSRLRGAGLFCKVDIRINSATYEGITWNATLWKGLDISMQSVHVMLVLSAIGQF